MWNASIAEALEAWRDAADGGAGISSALRHGCAGNARSRPLSILKSARLPITNDRAVM
jgi:hypothetical protein